MSLSGYDSAHALLSRLNDVISLLPIEAQVMIDVGAASLLAAFVVLCVVMR